MKFLHIMDYNRHVLGTLTQDSDGRLRLDVFASAYMREFSALMEEITRAPMPFHTYDRIILPDVDRMVSKILYLRPEDPDFFWAVREYVNRHPISDIPVIGHIVNKPAKTPNIGASSQVAAR